MQSRVCKSQQRGWMKPMQRLILAPSSCQKSPTAPGLSHEGNIDSMNDPDNILCTASSKHLKMDGH